MRGQGAAAFSAARKRLQQSADDAAGTAAEARKQARRGWKRSRKQLDKTAGEIEKNVRNELPRAGRSLDEPLDSVRSATGKFTSAITPARSAGLLVALAPAAAYGLLRAGARRRLPIQRSVDIAAPLEFVYDEWMQLEFLPEGAHRVQEIEREDDRGLVGEIAGPVRSHDWQAEIRDERECESFAWHSRTGSDCAGLITFHQLAERLTRLEMQLDVLPTSPREAIELALHTADRRAEAELRRFKSRLETVNPDAYGGGSEQDTNDKEG